MLQKKAKRSFVFVEKSKFGRQEVHKFRIEQSQEVLQSNEDSGKRTDVWRGNSQIERKGDLQDEMFILRSQFVVHFLRESGKVYNMRERQKLTFFKGNR